MSSITSSPFYPHSGDALPDGVEVEGGNLYVIDDEGGVVFQVFTDESALDYTAKGSIDRHGGVAVIHNNLPLMAISHVQNSSFKPQQAFLNNNVVISNLLESGRTPPTKSSFIVPLEGNDYFIVYNVSDKNGQLALVHAPFDKISRSPTDTSTDILITGLLYIQYGSNVYIGSVEPIWMSILNP